MRKVLPIAALGLCLGCNGAGNGTDAERAALKAALTTATRPSYVSADAEGRKLWKLTRQFYERRNHAPAWVDGTRPLPQIEQLVSALKASNGEGLDSQLYGSDLLEQRLREANRGLLTRKGFERDEAGALDIWLSYVYMKYASDLADGLSDLAHADPRWHIKPEKFDPAGHLERALTTGAIDRSLAELAPAHPEYGALRAALRQYREIASAGGWPALPRNLTLRPGQRSPHVARLASRLAMTGDYTGPIPSGDAPAVYAVELANAVRQFQRRHGLADDGVISPQVVAELNVPVQRRIRQIELNLERWRWLPRTLGDRYIVVNIPEYQLEVRQQDHVPLRMRVVVGKPDTPTPIFDGEMTYIVLSPYWNVPPEIAEGETLPEVLKDPGFLERANMEVVDLRGKPVDPSDLDLSDPTRYRFRQRPGAENSLGLVKFMFPNEHNVYLHDTPADSLFARAARSFSHGCVRLEQPLALAEYVLRDRPEWTRERIEEAMHAGEERVVKLPTAIPVYLVYWTARVSPDGLLQFRRDVYGIDGQQTARLNGRLARLRKTAAAAPAARKDARSGGTAAGG